MQDDNDDGSGIPVPFDKLPEDPANSLPVFQDNAKHREGNDTSQPRVIRSMDVPPEEDPFVPPQHLGMPSGSHPQTLEGEYTSEDRDAPPKEGAASNPNLPTDLELSYRGGERPPEIPSSIVGPLRNIQYSAIHDRISLLEQLSKTIPLNPFGLPLFLYRPDFLDYTQFQAIPTVDEAKGLQQQLSTAMYPISYTQGFPAQADAMPIWAKFPWESNEGYSYFAEYLEQRGVRSLHGMMGVDLSEAYSYFVLDYWATRAKSFDLYQSAHLQRKRVDRILSTEDNHYEQAGKMMKRLKSRMESFTDDDWDNVDPKMAVDIFEKLSRVQRISAGLPANGATDPSKREVARTIDAAMVALTEDQKNAELGRQDSEEIDLLRDRPDLVDAAQELILKLSTGHRNDSGGQ
jgi:hypothetical protein